MKKMKKKSLILVVLCLVVCLIIGILFWLNLQNKSNPETSLRLNWLTTCSYAGEVVGAETFAKKYNLNIRIDKGGPGLDPIKLVQSDVNTFGVAGADLVLIANDKGADFIIIGVVNNNSPGVWVSKAEKNIKSIADIKPDTRIGELPGGNMIYLYEVLLKRTGLTRNTSFKPVPIPFELKNFLTGDECDLRPIFNYEVLPELELLNIKYNIIEPKNLNIDFKGPVYFCKRSTLDNNQLLVKHFVFSMIDGWNYALQNPEDAIIELQKFDNSINIEKELLGLKVGKEYLQGFQGKLLYSDRQSWESMIRDMTELGFLKNHVDLDKVLYLNYVEEYYSK